MLDFLFQKGAIRRAQKFIDQLEPKVNMHLPEDLPMPSIKVLKKLCEQTSKINGFEKPIEALSDDQLKAKTDTKFERQFEIYPNPCSYEANIRYSVKDNENFEISVVNIFGQVELSLIKGKQSKGVYNLTFNTNSLKNGIYICILQTDDEIKTIKFIKTSELK